VQFGEQQTDAHPVVIRWAHKIVNAIFIIGILGLIASLMQAGFTATNPTHTTWAWAFAYYFVFSLMAAVLFVALLLIHSISARTLIYLKWPFVLFTLTYLVLKSSRDFVLPRLTGSDTFHVRVFNGSAETIDIVEIFGRGNHVTFEGLRADSIKSAAYRGREINFQAGDPYSNRVRVFWYAGGKWREQGLVDGSTMIGDSIVVVFRTSDSVALAPALDPRTWHHPARND
jgi:hypothetical protein